MALLLSGLLLPVAFGQQRLNIKPPTQIVVPRSGQVRETLQITVERGYHVNSDKPRDQFLIPLQLTWAPGPVRAESVTYPKSEQLRVGGDDLVVFTGTFPIESRLRAEPNVPPGPALLAGKLRYQACNNQMCFRPATVEVRVPVVVQ